LNGKEIGSKPAPDLAKLIVPFEVPYATGELRAIAYRDGQEIASLALKTVSKPERLRLKVDRDTIRASREDLAFVTLEITDAQGAPVPDIIRRIDFLVDGAGELAAVGNANPKDAASFRVPFCRTFRGKCLAVLRPLGGEGQITLSARSEGLSPASVVVKCARSGTETSIT
jgi:beta-galactosidase